jgi:hypothetical protein
MRTVPLTSLLNKEKEMQIVPAQQEEQEKMKKIPSMEDPLTAISDSIKRGLRAYLNPNDSSYLADRDAQPFFLSLLPPNALALASDGLLQVFCFLIFLFFCLLCIIF